MGFPATTTRKGKRRNKRSCYVCRTEIESRVEATKIVRADGVPGGIVRTLFWFCERHSELFLMALGWKGEDVGTDVLVQPAGTTTRHVDKNCDQRHGKPVGEEAGPAYTSYMHSAGGI